MKFGILFLLLVAVTHAGAETSEPWGPELIAFDLEGQDKMLTMTWVSGWSYATTELLKSFGCLGKNDYIGSRELIEAINQRATGHKISSEFATVILGDYIRAKYSCASI